MPRRIPKSKKAIHLPIPSTSNIPVPLFHFAQHSHSSSTSNFRPKVSLGNARVELHQMRSELPILSAQVKHALSHNPLYER